MLCRVARLTPGQKASPGLSFGMRWSKQAMLFPMFTEWSLLTLRIAINTPNRGLSPYGWPEWPEVMPPVPSYVVSGSRFLTELNGAPRSDISRVEYVAVWFPGVKGL